MLMTRLGVTSHFELISEKALPAFGDRIIQMDTTKQYTNEAEFAVFVCEINDAERDGMEAENE